MTTDLVPAQLNALAELSGAVEFGPLGLTFHRDLEYSAWERLGTALQYMDSAVHWWIGDWIRYGERRWGEKYAQAIQETPYSYGTLRHDVYVAERVDPCRRRPLLTWSHHQEVASLPPEKQDEWLDQAEQEHWSRETLRQHIREERAQRQDDPAVAPVLDLVECPFCHGTDLDTSTEPPAFELWRVVCRTCLARGPLAAGARGAQVAWNRREEA
ncbi:MAG: LmbU family transcriptional regulator [Phycisphaerae bacterium]|jgi:hypothetical protein